jgi:hypothetical protein
MTRQRIWNCLSLTAPMNSCSSSAMVKRRTRSTPKHARAWAARLAGHLELLHVL